MGLIKIAEDEQSTRKLTHLMRIFSVLSVKRGRRAHRTFRVVPPSNRKLWLGIERAHSLVTRADMGHTRNVHVHVHKHVTQ